MSIHPKILAVDTSLDYCALALGTSSQHDIRYTLAEQNHGRVLLPMIHDLLTEAHLQLKDLDAIAFANGPGSFTGLRMSAAVIQGLALPLKLPIITVSTLQALAHQAFKKNHEISYVVSAIDARMEQMYAACYEFKKGRIKNITEEMLIMPQSFKVPFKADWHFLGNAFDVYQDLFKEKEYTADEKVEPLAEDILSIAFEKYERKEYGSALNVQLHYLQTPKYQLSKKTE